ncbi:MAG: Mini-ribonuclease 3 [Clostridiales bacterium]|jgi:ribonuclease-3 family protein|nr:Mini-ribonuclease 3 [Clostridiales bacterium]
MSEMLPPILLAYVGDAVFELYIRQALIRQGAKPVNQLHRAATRFTSAAGQAEILRWLEPQLTEEEMVFVRRGRNTKSKVPKNADMAEYRLATGLETLFGYLYLSGAQERLDELFSFIDVGEV